ncbi:hypothetical protein ACYSNW_16705 [Enterococcus sp. LJL99]
MLRLVIFLSAGLLILLSFFLLKKTTIFLSLMRDDEILQNRQFLQKSAYFDLFLALLGILAGILNQFYVSLLYIILLLVSSAVFSLLFSKKIR